MMMSSYKPEQLETCLRSLFDRIRDESPAAVESLLLSQSIIKLRISDPLVEITVNGRRRPFQTTFGPSTLRPDLEFRLSASTLHLILSDRLSLKQGVANGDIKVRGPIWKTRPMAEIIRAGRALYPSVVAEQRWCGDA